MKKVVSLLLVLTMACTLLAGCGDRTPAESTAPAMEVPGSALEILETIWADYSEEEKFPIGGGDMENFVMGAPGQFSLDNVQALSYTLMMPEESLSAIDDAATLLHGMNTNIFSSGALHMAEGTDLEALAGTVRENILGNQWMCGFPEILMIATIADEYLLVSFGNGEIMGNFQKHLEAVYPGTQILYVENVIE